MSKQYKDEFTQAEKELSEKSAYVCKNCNKTYKKEDAVKKDLTCCGRTLTELLQEGFGP